MIQYEPKHLPDAVYIDTNALRSVGHVLNKPWMTELRSLTTLCDISLCITNLVLMEWSEYIYEQLQKNYQKLLSALDFLEEYHVKVPDHGEPFLKLPDKNGLIKIVGERLNEAGFEIIRDWHGSLEQLIVEAVNKRPPFETGGKGFRDAIILESFASHASEKFEKPRVFVISNDDAVMRAEERFTQRDINVTFVRENEVVDKLKALLKDEAARFWKERQDSLDKLVRSHEKEIVDFVSKSRLKFSDWWLMSPLSEKEERLEGFIHRILSAKPTGISRVVGGAPHFREELSPDRYPVDIWVEMELEIVFSPYTAGWTQFLQPRAIAQPEMIDAESPLTLESRISAQPVEKHQTIKRAVTVQATVDAAGAKRGEYRELKLERVY